MKTKNWQLWMCDQANGRDFLYHEGPRSEMEEMMYRAFHRNRDVWMIGLDGEKVLPKLEAAK